MPTNADFPAPPVQAKAPKVEKPKFNQALEALKNIFKEKEEPQRPPESALGIRG